MSKIKVYRDVNTGAILKREPVQQIEEIHDLDITDSVVVCESTGCICKLQDSSQGKSRLKELQSQKEHTDFEKSEMQFLDGSFDEKIKASQGISNKKILVNITTEDGERKAVIHDKYTEDMQLDEDRGDRLFDSKKDAKEYAKAFNS